MEDNYYLVSSSINDKDVTTIIKASCVDEAFKHINFNGMCQRMETYNYCAYSGKVLDKLYFQFHNGFLYLFNKSGIQVRKTMEDSQFTYKFLKNTVKCRSFADLLHFTYKTANDLNDPFNRVYFNLGFRISNDYLYQKPLCDNCFDNYFNYY